MKKLIILLAILAALWASPPIRARMTFAAQPLLERLGPVGDRLLDPARKYGTKSDLAALVRLYSIDRNENRRLPTPAEFPAWARRKWGAEPVDRWGNPFWLVTRARTIVIGSNGADGRRGTEDDIEHTHTF